MTSILNTLRITSVGLILTGLTFGASFQSGDSIKVHLPFAARIGQTMVPAGEYSIRNIDAEQPILAVQSDEGVHFLVAARRITVGVNHASKNPFVVLTLDGDDYRVSRIVISGLGNGYEILPVATDSKEQ